MSSKDLRRTLAGLVALSLLGAVACDKKESTSPDEATAAEPEDEVEAPAETEEPVEEEPAEPEAAALNKAQFDETINAHMEEVTDCYLTALESNGELAGTLNAQFEFDEEGTVTGVVVLEGSTLDDEDLAKCIHDAAQSWEFGKPPKGAMSLQYPFTLEPA